MHTAYVALGANLDEPIAQIRRAFQALTRLSETRVLNTSSLYRTSPVDAPGQPDYINAVACLETELSPSQLLQALQNIENDFGRRRDFFHAPRTLDLDLLLYEDCIIDTSALQLPHPRMHLRAFVLAPLVEICDDCMIPERGSAKAWLTAVSLQAIEKIAL